jgi:hypothetical protein
MPKFNNREEYEQWKEERLKNNIGKVQEQKEEGEGEVRHVQQNDAPPVSAQSELRPISQLFSDSWELFKSRFGTLIALYLLSFILFLIIIGLFVGAGLLFSVLFPYGRNIILAGGILVGIIPGFAVMFWFFTAFVFAVTDESLSIRDALGYGWKKMGPFIWLYSVLSYIITGGMLLFLIPGIIFMIWFTFSQFILACEDIRGMNALLKSKEYVKTRWFDIFLRLFMIWLIEAVFGIIPLIGTILSILFFPFTMIFTFLIYQDLRTIKGQGLPYLDTSGEKFKWIGLGTLGYVVFPLFIIALFGASLTIPFIIQKILSGP